MSVTAIRPGGGETAAPAPAAAFVVGRALLGTLVFCCGFASLGVELAGSRLLAPYFGTSLYIWAVLVGLILLYLTVGYFLGGRLADRRPSLRLLLKLVAWAGLLTGLIPLVARPILSFSAVGFAELDAGIFLGSLVGVVLLFAVPVTLLGCVSPFAIRLVVRGVADAGRVSGRLYALSTAGSIIGTFVTVFVLVPWLGTPRTFYLFSLLLIGVSSFGLWGTVVSPSPSLSQAGEELDKGGRGLSQAGKELDRGGRGLSRLGGELEGERPARGRRSGWYFWFLLPIACLAVLPEGVLRPPPFGRLIYSAESAYYYIQVVQEDTPAGPQNDLILDEGHAIHSIYTPGQLLTGDEWDYFMLAPFFNPGERTTDVHSAAIVGLAGGTIAREMTAVFGPIPIDGAEIDPKILEVGRRYFGMTEPNLHAYAQDGRYFIVNSGKKYDVVAVDAYRQPYIPFHLTTRQFFQEVRDHLTPDGVAVMNVGRTATDYRLVNVIASTMKAVYPNVYTIDLPDPRVNTIVVGTNRPTNLADFETNLAAATNPTLRAVAGTVVPLGRVKEFTATSPVFTDDWAPVEQVIDQIILGYARGGQ